MTFTTWKGGVDKQYDIAIKKQMQQFAKQWNPSGKDSCCSKTTVKTQMIDKTNSFTP